MDFKLVSDYRPSGDQPQAIEGLVNGVNWGLREQTLLGVTGSGKTFTMASVIAKLKLLSCREVGEGSVNYASVPIRRCVEMALEDGATSVILAYNHPSGIALPSGDDILTTRRLAAALSTVEIQLVDHIIVADEDYISMVQSGYRFDDCVIY